MSQNQANAILDALGGWENVDDVEACITRIRVHVKDEQNVDDDALRAAGAFDVIRVGANVQVVMGPQAEAITEAIQALK